MLREVICKGSSGLSGGSVVKNLPAMQETQVQSLGQEEPLEKEMATYSGILSWRISWTEEPAGLQSMGLQRVRHNSVTNNFTFSQTGGRGHVDRIMGVRILLELGTP